MARDKEAMRRELQRLSDCARLGAKLELHVGVSHGVTLQNVKALISLGGIHRVNVGHDLIARAVMVGVDEAVREWVDLLANGSPAG